MLVAATRARISVIICASSASSSVARVGTVAEARCGSDSTTATLCDAARTTEMLSWTMMVHREAPCPSLGLGPEIAGSCSGRVAVGLLQRARVDFVFVIRAAQSRRVADVHQEGPALDALLVGLCCFLSAPYRSEYEWRWRLSRCSLAGVGSDAALSSSSSLSA